MGRAGAAMVRGYENENFLDAHLCAKANRAALNQAAHNKGIPWLGIRDIPAHVSLWGRGSVRTSRPRRNS